MKTPILIACSNHVFTHKTSHVHTRTKPARTHAHLCTHTHTWRLWGLRLNPRLLLTTFIAVLSCVSDRARNPGVLSPRIAKFRVSLYSGVCVCVYVCVCLCVCVYVFLTASGRATSSWKEFFWMFFQTQWNLSAPTHAVALRAIRGIGKT